MTKQMVAELLKPDGYYLNEWEDPIICPFCKMIYNSGATRKHISKCPERKGREYRRDFRGYLYIVDEDKSYT